MKPGFELGIIAIAFFLISPTSSWILRRRSAKKLKLDTPNIKAPSVGAYRKNFRGDVTKIIAETPNSEVTLPELRFEDHNWEGHSIELDCNASYPVNWVYSGVGAPPVHMRTHRITPDFFDKESYIYQASVVFTHTTAQQTGNYTCQSLNLTAVAHLASFLYLFVPGNGIFMVDVEEPQTVVAIADEPWVTLPCSVSDSDARVILLKKHSSGIEVLKPGRHLTFDPKVGFQIQWRDFHEPWADYICIGQTEANTEQLDITLTKPVPQNQRPENRPTSTVENWTSNNRGIIFIADEANDRLLCCSNTRQRPSMKSTGCTSVSDCSLRRSFLDAKRCPPSCEQHVEKVGKACVSYEMSDMHDESGMLRCSVGDIVEYFVFSKENDHLVTNFTVLPPIDKILNIYVEDSPKPGKLFISCHANSFFFSNGLKWASKLPNGTMVIVQDQRPPASPYLEVVRKENLGNTIYCFAPVWNSPTEWKSQSIVIK